MRKTESARIALERAQSATSGLNLREERLHAANVEALVRDHDVVIDGADNFPTRYLLNAACLRLEDSARLWRGASFHRTSQRVRSAARRFAVLPLPVSRTAFCCRSAELQRGRRTWRAARSHRSPAGNRGDQARARHRAPLVGRLALLRRTRRGIPRALDCRAIQRALAAVPTPCSMATKTSPCFATALDDRLRTIAAVT